jgi:hypothetical protein
MLISNQSLRSLQHRSFGNTLQEPTTMPLNSSDQKRRPVGHDQESDWILLIDNLMGTIRHILQPCRRSAPASRDIIVCLELLQASLSNSIDLIAHTRRLLRVSQHWSRRV